MSNNNPHGHITQPAQNPSWNPLQIPSYIPRQPQLAHMSNERPMVRSPLAWHAPAPPPESIYNFMSANHKNLEHQMNPLLPPFVRGPSPFDSMDLSLQSSRSSSSPLTKGGHSGMTQHDYGHKQQQHTHQQQQHQQQSHQQQQQSQQQHQQQPQSQMHGQNNYPIHNLSTNSPSSSAQHALQQQQQPPQHSQQQHASMSAPAPQHPHAGMQSGAVAPPPSSSPAVAASAIASNAKYLNSNGNDCETMLPPASAVGSSSSSGGNGNGGISMSAGSVGGGGGPSASAGNNNNTVGGTAPSSGGPSPVHYMRESDARLSENYAKMSQMNRSYDSELQSKAIQKPVELVNKDCSYTTMMPNKMATHQQQVSPKKHSPLRNYHTLQQQQQQQQSPYNNPPSVKHNGPHTPPTPQSPVMHQPPPQTASGKSTSSQQQQQLQSQPPPTIHGNIDYNQLHLQQQNSYTQHHQQQQQHLPTHLQQHQLHYSHHHHHLPPHMHPQQQQQQQHPQQARQHHQQQQQHSQLQQPPQQHQQLHQQHHSPMHTHHSNLINLDNYSPRTEAKVPPEVNLDKSSSSNADLSNVIPPAGYKPADTSGLPDSAESPDAVSSNDESFDSNSNSSGCRLRRKRKTNKIVRQSSNESEVEEVTAPSELPPSRSSNSRSPKTSSDQARKSSPRKGEIHVPRIPLERVAYTPPTAASASASPAPNASHLPQHTEDSEPSNDRPQTIENGQMPAAGTIIVASVADEVETIDKIAQMIAKTGCDSSNGSSIRTNPELVGSPKTKKQRQALKLRNAEHQNSNSNCSSNSYNECVPPNDNAVQADELLSKESHIAGATSVRAATPLPPPLPTAATSNVRPLSPQSNSRSSSSSSSSSSCSNSSRSSSKSHKTKNSANPTLPSADAAATIKPTSVEKENVREGVIQISSSNKVAKDSKENVVSLDKPSETPINLNNTAVSSDDIAKTSPTKSCFEEVENKLEEMFAGIEDEPTRHEEEDRTAQPLANEAEVATELTLALELAAINAANNIKENNAKDTTDQRQQAGIPTTNASEETTAARPPPTKAAKKSTVPSPVKATTPPPPPIEPQEKPPAAVTLPKRITPPRRRLSVNMDPANLRITFESETNKKDQPVKRKKSKAIRESFVHLDDELPSTSAAAAAALAAKETRAAKEFATSEPKTTPKGQTKGQGNSRKRGISKTKKGGGNGGLVNTPKGGGKNGKQNQQKQRRKQNSSDDEKPLVREVTIAEPKYKSPFILVKRDGSISVINAPSAEDVHEKQTKVKKAAAYAHDRKNIRGLHSSTLSNKYDADTTDSTWICVFCKRGPHRMGLGDLFGPYLVSVDCEEYKTAIRAPDALDLDAVFVSKRRRVDMVKYNARNLPVVPAMGQQQRAGMNKKKKKSLDDVSAHQLALADPLDCSSEAAVHETFIGMGKVSESTFEIWLHEDCTVWAPDVFLVGSRVMGLDAAVWNSTRYTCTLCGKAGAIICCLQRDCKAAAHVPCARESHWHLNDANLQVHCQKHSSVLPPSRTLPAISRIATTVAAATVVNPPPQATVVAPATITPSSAFS